LFNFVEYNCEVVTVLKGGLKMSDVKIKDHIWLSSLFYYLYPMFIKKQIVKNSEDPYLQVLRYLHNDNQFFRKYFLSIEDQVDKLPIIHLFLENASKLCTQEQGDFHEINEYRFRPLQSVFSRLFNQDGENSSYPMKPLSLSNLLPSTKSTGDLSESLFSSFLEELKKIKNKEQLFYLFEKYFWGVASFKSSDISLYDEMKTTAAIAVTLYKQYEKDLLKLDDLENLNDKSHFLLIHGDVSGIQDFIFNIPSKGAAKSLKGRSVYIQFLSDVIVRFLLDKLKLDSTHLLYNGGGNFFILSPYYQQDVFEKVRKEILYHVLHGHDGKVYFAIDCVPVSLVDFRDFSSVWEKVKMKTNLLKKRKWSELGLEEHYYQIFGPLDGGIEEKEVCKVCRSFGSKRPIHQETFQDQSVSICTLCKSFIELTNQLRDAQYIIYRKKGISQQGYQTYQDVFHHFGYEVNFYSQPPKALPDSSEHWYKINDTNFLEDHCSGFHFGAYQLPKEKERQITFEELSKRAIVDGYGDSKIAHLKLDVDNLGTLFNQGLGNRRSISRVSVLSRMLGLYFGGYINQLIQENEWQEKLYVVFSGGDDTYIIGTWRDVFQFAEKFYQHFRLFTGHNPYVTFSAGINVFPYQYPLTRAADLTEHALDTAKKINHSSQSNLPSKKNKISFLGEVFNWEEFKQIKELQVILTKLVCKYNRSVLFKVSKSTLGFKHILKDSTKGKFEHVKFWRLSYYLSDIKKEYENSKKKNKPIFEEDYVQQLIDKYRQIVIHNLFQSKDKEQIRKILIIPSAIKWAELATRKLEKEEG